MRHVGDCVGVGGATAHRVGASAVGVGGATACRVAKLLVAPEASLSLLEIASVKSATALSEIVSAKSALSLPLAPSVDIFSVARFVGAFVGTSAGDCIWVIFCWSESGGC